MKKMILVVTAFLFTTALFAKSADSSRYRIVVMFGSRGDGIPDAQPLLNHIAAFKKKNKVKKISYDRIGPMGREGEYYMAFPLKELTRRQTTAFISQLKKIAAAPSARGYITLEENFALSKAEAAGKTTRLKL